MEHKWHSTPEQRTPQNQSYRLRWGAADQWTVSCRTHRLGVYNYRDEIELYQWIGKRNTKWPQQHESAHQTHFHIIIYRFQNQATEIYISNRTGKNEEISFHMIQYIVLWLSWWNRASSRDWLKEHIWHSTPENRTPKNQSYRLWWGAADQWTVSCRTHRQVTPNRAIYAFLFCNYGCKSAICTK